METRFANKGEQENVGAIWCWSIWSVCNNFIFKAIQLTSQMCKEIFKQEFALVIHEQRKITLVLLIKG